MNSSALNFDVLFIVSRIERVLGEVTTDEVNCFSYFACLLWIASGRSAEEWGYSYTSTVAGTPYCGEMAKSIDDLRLNGFLVETPSRGVKVSESGQVMVSRLQGFSLYKDRVVTLNAAVWTANVYPIGVIRYAIGQDPSVRAGKEHITQGWLLKSALQLEMLSDVGKSLYARVGGPTASMRVEASTWLENLLPA